MAPSDEEDDMARPVGAEPVQLCGKLFRAPELAVDRERNDKRRSSHARGYARPRALGLHHLCFAQRVGCFFIYYLNNLEFEVGSN